MPDYGGPSGFGGGSSSGSSSGGDNGGGGGTPGLGGSQDAASGFSMGPADTGSSDSGPSAAEVQAAINAARATGKTIGVFGPEDYGNNEGILGLIGYNPEKTVTENIYDMVVPGQNTPLGALSAVPGLLGASQTVQGIVGLANAIAGKIGKSEAQSKSTISDSVVGKDSIVGQLGTPTTGIASGMPDTGYKGDFQ